MKIDQQLLQLHYFIINYRMDSNDNQELLKKFKRKTSFNKEMNEISDKFKSLEQEAVYADLSIIRNNMLIKIDSPGAKLAGKHSKITDTDYYVFLGYLQPTGDKSFQKLLLHIIKKIPRPLKNFGIIYVNSLADSDAYTDFKKILEFMTIEYFLNLKCIYLLNPSFYHKASSWLTFGTINNFLKNKTINVETLQEICQDTGISQQYIISLMPEKLAKHLLKSEDQIKTMKKVVKDTFYTNMLFPEIKDKDREQSLQDNELGELKKIKSEDIAAEKPVYKSHINFGSKGPKLPEKPTQFELEDYEVGQTGVPLVLELLLFYFNSNPEELKIEGLLRKSVSIDDERQILLNLNQKNYEFLQHVDDPHLIANAIKRFFGLLKLPLVPYLFFNQFMVHEGSPGFEEFVIASIKQLNQLRFMTLMRLLQFLIKQILPQSVHNKMNENNICIVMGPCIMRSEISSIKDLIYAQKIIKVMQILINNFEKIFGDNEAQHNLYRKSWKTHRKVSLKERIGLNKESSQPEEFKIALENKVETEEKHQLNSEGADLIHKTTQFLKNSLQLDSDSENSEGDNKKKQKEGQLKNEQKKQKEGQIKNEQNGHPDVNKEQVHQPNQFHQKKNEEQEEQKRTKAKQNKLSEGS